MLSGRYRTDQLIRHFSSENSGACSLCKNDDITGSIEHLLVRCPVLNDIRKCIMENLETNKNLSVTTKALISYYLQDTETNEIQLILNNFLLYKFIFCDGKSTSYITQIEKILKFFYLCESANLSTIF